MIKLYNFVYIILKILLFYINLCYIIDDFIFTSKQLSKAISINIYHHLYQ